MTAERRHRWFFGAVAVFGWVVVAYGLDRAGTRDAETPLWPFAVVAAGGVVIAAIGLVALCAWALKLLRDGRTADGRLTFGVVISVSMPGLLIGGAELLNLMKVPCFDLSGDPCTYTRNALDAAAGAAGLVALAAAGVALWGLVLGITSSSRA